MALTKRRKKIRLQLFFPATRDKPRSLVLVCVVVNGRKENNNGHSNTKSPTEPIDEGCLFVPKDPKKRAKRDLDCETHLCCFETHESESRIDLATASVRGRKW